MEKIAFITGSTSGIGEATAWKFAAEGWHVIISGRRIEKLNTLAARIQEKHQVAVLPLCFDITQLEEVKNSIHSLSGKWKNIGVLVNNAGLAVGRSPLQEGLYEDWDRMIDTNMKGLLYVTREIVPLFIANKKGHIINIGSLAGHEYYGGGNVYCGTKHAVKAITRSMRIDLLREGIKVSAVSPGAVETEFSVVRYKGNKEMADKTYDGFEPLKAEDVAESIYFIANQPKHVNIEEILVLPTAQASTSIIFKQ